jgi:hypothetical protein
MDEPEVVLRVRNYFEAQGFKLKGQPNEGDIVLNGGEIRVDLQGFREMNPPDLIWIECKGDDTQLKELLSDFISLLLVISQYGGQAIFACPSQSYNKIIAYKEFLDILQNNIGKGQVKIFNVESNQQ